MPEQTSRKHHSAPCDLPYDLAVIILNYNTCSLLRDCLQSVRPDRHSLRMCVYVVDNASSDGSAEMVRREFPTVHLIANTTNVGYSAGNNVSLALPSASTNGRPRP